MKEIARHETETLLNSQSHVCEMIENFESASLYQQWVWLPKHCLLRQKQAPSPLATTTANLQEVTIEFNHQHGSHTIPQAEARGKENSVMWLRWSLCLLYVLQLMVLSGMVAAYLYDISRPQPPAPQIEETAPPAFRPPTSTARVQSNHFKPVVKMKSVRLSYLRERIASVKSPVDLIRLFTDSNLDDHLLTRWMSRNIRSAPLATSHGLKLSRGGRHAHTKAIRPQGKDYSVDGEETSKEIRQSTSVDDGREYEYEETGIVEREDIVDIKETVDNDELYDYPRDEPTMDQEEAFLSAMYHIHEMDECPVSRCKDPKPFVQHVSDPNNVNRIFFPDCTILYRCMNFSGCCGDGNHECAPKTMSIVSRAFLVFNRQSALEDQEFVLYDPRMATTISFVNHTECECREKPKIPKCTKECPEPFRLTQEGADCKCRCMQSAHHSNWDCEGVMDGVKPLSQKGLVCIKRGNCYVPQCAVGEFEIKSGLCPLSDEYTLPTFLFDNPEDRRYYREHLRSYDFSKPFHDFSRKARVPDEDPTFPQAPRRSGNSALHGVHTGPSARQAGSDRSDQSSKSLPTEPSVSHASVENDFAARNITEQLSHTQGDTLNASYSNTSASGRNTTTGTQTQLGNSMMAGELVNQNHDNSTNTQIVHNSTQIFKDALNSNRSSHRELNENVQNSTHSQNASPQTDQERPSLLQELVTNNKTAVPKLELANGKYSDRSNISKKSNDMKSKVALKSAAALKSPPEETTSLPTTTKKSKPHRKKLKSRRKKSKSRRRSKNSKAAKSYLARKNFRFQMSSHYHENIRPYRSQRRSPTSKNTMQADESVRKTATTVGTTTTRSKPLSTTSSSPPKIPNSQVSSSQTNPSHRNVDRKHEKLPRTGGRSWEDLDSVEREVLNGFYSYDYAALDGSGEDFEYGVT